MLNITLQVSENEAVLTLKTDKEEFVERHEMLGFDRSRLTTKPIYEQLEDAGMCEEFVNAVYDATENFYTHELLSICYEWQ